MRYSKQWRNLKGNSRKAAAALGKGRYVTACNHLMKEVRFRDAARKQIGKIIRNECKILCSRSFDSKFRVQSMEDLKNVKISELTDEIKEKAPFTDGALNAITGNSNGTDKRKSEIRQIVAFGTLICQRNRQVNVMQKLISILLYRAKARVKVSRFYIVESAQNLSRAGFPRKYDQF